MRYICSMNKFLIIAVFYFLFFKLEAQEKRDSIDIRYLEDQIYFSLTYNILIEKPSLIAQNGFSGGISIGFIKDLPINKKRTFGLGLGLGYNYDVYIQNLKITRENQSTLFGIAQDYKINRFRLSRIEIPIELRWRNSTPQKYKFFRVYTGVKFSYIVSSKTEFTDITETIITNNIPEFNKIQYGLTLAAGYGTWNLYIYYGLNPFFKDAQLNGENLNLKDLAIGLKFYIM